MNSLTQQSTADESTPIHRLSVCGVGWAGSRILGLLESTLAEGELWTVDSEVPTSPPDRGISRLEIGARITRGLGSGGDAVHAQRIAEMESSKIQERIHSGLLILVAGIGGGVGAGMSPVLARLARQAGAVVVAVAIEPFDFEGGLRHHNASQCLAALQGTCEAVIRVSNQAMVRLSSESAAVQELFTLADRFVAQVVDGLLRLLSCGPALRPVGLAELERWARGRQSEGVAAVAVAEGNERIRTLWTQLEHHPFLQPAARLTEAEGVLLNVVGGPDLRLEELEFLHQELQRRSPKAQILVGAGLDPKLEGRIQALLLVVHDGVGLRSALPARGTDSPDQRPMSVKSLLFEDADQQGDSRTDDLDRSSRSREAFRSRSSFPTNRKAQQQQFNFVPPWIGRFDNAEGSLHGGENLDEPTFVRRGVKFN